MAFRLHLPASLRSRPVTALLRYYGRSDSCFVPVLRQGFSLHERWLFPRTGLPDSRAWPLDPSVSTHLSVPDIAFPRYPSAHRASHSASEWVWASPLTCRLAEHSGRIEFVILRTGLSPPVAPHPASQRRSFFRFQAGERMPEEDFHLSDHSRFQAHMPPAFAGSEPCFTFHPQLALWARRIGVGRTLRFPLPPNRTSGFPASGSPVGGYLQQV